MPCWVSTVWRAAARMPGQSARSRISRWADSAMVPDDSVHTCRSCTRSTPSSLARSWPTASSWIPSGTPSISTCTTSRSRRSADTRISAATSSDSSGSIGVQPVVTMTMPAVIAATEPSASPSTWSSAARLLSVCSPRLSTQATTRLIARPTTATPMTVPPAMSRGAPTRSRASRTMKPISTSIRRLLNSAASTSARTRP